MLLRVSKVALNHLESEIAVRIRFALAQMGSLAHYPRDVARFAHRAEQLGADSLWVGRLHYTKIGRQPFLGSS